MYSSWFPDYDLEVRKDMRTLADAYLAEHPADDDALATAVSLEAEGFEFRFNRWQYHVACLTVTVRLSGPDVGLWIETPSLMTKLVDAIPTNRHVRRLISALEGK